MFITLQQLERKPVPFQVALPAGEIEFGRDVTQTSPLMSEGLATLINHSLGEIRIKGSAQVNISAACDRCLEQVAVPVESAFDLVYVPASTMSGGEAEVDEAGIEVGYYEGSGLELNDVLREVVLLALPMRVVCNDACKGICPVCGLDRNGGTDCDCQTTAADDRWNKLKEFRPRTA